MKIAKNKATAFFLTALLSASAGMAMAQAGGKTYKWVDDKGVVHYSDKAPLEAVNREQTVLDKQGRAVQKIEALTPESKRKLSEEEIEKLRLEQVQKETAERKDRALLLSYLKEDDFDFARDRALSALDAQIASSQLIMTQQQNRYKELLERKEAGKKPAEGELEKLEAEIGARNASINRDRHEKEILFAKYEQDKKRWRELKDAEKAQLEAEKQAKKK